MSTRVYLIRHAEALGNINRTFQGRVDETISENGEQQLINLAQRCKDIPIDAIYTSPLLRAQRTAQAVNTYHHLPIQTDARLLEIDGGDFEGRRWEDLPRLFPDKLKIWQDTPWAFVAPAGESMRQVYDRMRDGILELVERHAGQSICVVSHGCAIRNFLCFALGLPYEQLASVPWCGNTAINQIDFDAQGTPQVIVQNDMAHLDAATQTDYSKAFWREPSASAGEGGAAT